MRTFSVPADFRTSTIDAYCELGYRYKNARVTETYGQATVGVMRNSGRNPRAIPPVGLDDLERYVAYSAENGIDFNYTFNASCLGNAEFTEKGIGRVNRFLGRLWDIGIRHLTVTLPPLMAIVRDSGYPFKVKISTICQINCASKAAFYKAQGFDRLVIDEDITRDFRRISQICEAFGEGVEMIANSLCLRSCPYKMFHYNYESHYSFARQDIRTFYELRCRAQKAANWTSALRVNWIRPEDLDLYEAVGVHNFKIQGRDSVIHGEPVRAVEAYMKGSYDGNLCDLLSLFDARKTGSQYHPRVDNRKLDGFIARFHDDPDSCTEDCDACGYCESFAKASIDRDAMDAMCRETLAASEALEPYEAFRKQSAGYTLAHRMARKVFSAVSRHT